MKWTFSTASGIQPLFGDVPVAQFIAEYLHRLPFALSGSAACACEFGTWDALGSMLGDGPGVDVAAVRGGEWHKGPAPADAMAARALCDDGFTVFIRHAERHHSGLSELARAFEATFCGPVNIHVFATPPGAPGFSWHYDAEDVFIIQTAGEKEYSLRKNTVNPWPLEETLPQDMQYERELMPLMRVLMCAGDLLYIPCGYWHKAIAGGWGLGTGDFEQQAGASSIHSPRFPVPTPRSAAASPQSPASSPQETAISLAVGVMSRSAMDVYDFLRTRLVQSLVWRQRLPVPDFTGRDRVELEATYRHLLAQLAGDAAKALADPRLAKEFLDQWEKGKGAGDGKASD